MKTLFGRSRPRSNPPCSGRFLSVCLVAVALAFQAAGAVDRSILTTAAAGVGQPDAGHDFAKVSSGAGFIQNHLLVRFGTGVSSAQRGQIVSVLGGQLMREYELVPGLCLVTLPAGQTVEQALLSYNGTPGILYAEPDYVVHTTATFPNDTRFPELWGMYNTGQTGGTAGADIHAPDAWDLTTGSRQIIVAVIDTGVDCNHPDLTHNIWTNPGEIPGNNLDDDNNGYVDDFYGYDFVNNVGDPIDDHGHGTHCSGTIGAEGNNSIGVAGVCWQVRIMALKFLAANGSGSTADAISAIQYGTLMGANVMNNSWGGGGYSQALKDAIDAAGAANITFAAAAGNSASDNDVIPQYPASYTSANIVAVLATDDRDARSGFSCWGLTSVDLGAPGSEILSCQPGGGYQVMSGTSMACPHVAGACALLLAANPALRVAEIKQALLSSVDPVVPGLCVSGGRLNMPKALRSLLPRGSLLLYTNYLSGGNGNGVIEFNECNNLNLVLTNLAITQVGNISAILVTATPGVAIAQGASAYPSIPGGGSGTNLTPFQISTTPSFLCGTAIKLSLILHSDLGLSVLDFSLPTGVAGNPIRFDNDTSYAIPASGATNSPVLVSNITFAIKKVAVSLFVEEPVDYFLKLELIAPDGSTNLLSANNGVAGANYGVGCGDSQRTIFDDDAITPIASGTAPFVGPFMPSKPLTGFIGQAGTNINGVWQLRATDSGNFGFAAIRCWSLLVTPTLCVDGGGQCPGADMAVGVTGNPNPVIQGNNLTYTIGVTNNGPSSTTNVTVTFYLPTTAVYVSASTSQGTYAQSGSVLTFRLGAMAPRATAALSVVVVPAAAGTIAATAIVASEQPDFLPANNSVAYVMQVNPYTAELAVGLVAGPTPALIGSTLTYTVSVTNNGPNPATGVTVTNVLATNVVIQAATLSAGSYTNSGNVIIWSLPLMSSADHATALIPVIPTAEGFITATATVGGNQFDPITANNTATVSTTIGAAADLAIAIITESTNPIVVTSNMTFRVAVTNRGPSTATGVIVNNNLPPGLPVVSSNSSQGTVLVSGSALTWNVGALGSGASAILTNVLQTVTVGTLTTTATVSSSQTDTNPANNSAVLTTVVAAPFVNIVPAEATLDYESGPTNGAVDIGETVRVTLRLRNAGNVPAQQVRATLQAGNGVTPIAGAPPLSLTNSQNYNVLWDNGTAVGRPFSFIAGGTNGGSVTATLAVQDGTSNWLIGFTFVLPRIHIFSSTNGAIPIPNPPNLLDPGVASPYPSVLNVSGFTGALGKVTITLSNLSHTFPGDINALLVAPSGAKALVMAGAGELPITGTTLTLDDFAPAPLPAAGQITPGTWQPAAYTNPAALPANAPPGPYQSSLSAFNGADPNGNWLLYLYDSGPGDYGVLSNGWSLALTTVSPVKLGADIGLSAAASPNPIFAGQNLNYTFSITNSGPGSSVPHLTVNLPAGVAVVSASPGGYTVAGQTVTFANFGKLGSGSVATATIVAQPTAAAIPAGQTNATITTSATASVDETTGDKDINLSNNSVSFFTTLYRPVADVALAQSVTNTVLAGYPLTNTVTITNRGPGTALNVTVTPSFTPTNVSFYVSPAQLTLNAGAVATVEVVAVPSPALIPAGGSETTVTSVLLLTTTSSDLVTTNNSATNTFTVVKPAPVIVNAGAKLNYESGPVNGAIDPGETITLSLALANDGTLATTADLTAILQTSGGVTTATSGRPCILTNVYGFLDPGRFSVYRTFTFKAAADIGASLTATLRCEDTALGYTKDVAFTFGTLAPTTYPGTNRITIPYLGAASPYPAFISVTNLAGHFVNSATVTLFNVSHPFPQDISALLVSPSGSNVLLMSHTGGGHLVSNVNLTFSDAAAGYLPNGNTLVAGTYKPTSYAPSVTLPGNPVSKPYGTTLSALEWSSANGNWLLYVCDDANGDAGFIADGWGLTLTTAPGIPIAYDPPVLSGRVSGGEFQLTVMCQPGFEYVVEGSSDFTSWVSLSTNNPVTGTFTFTDNTTPAPRFYRVLGR